MRYIVGICLVALLGWCGWWWVASSAQRTAWEQLLEGQRGIGRTAEAQISIKGFPNRVDTTLTAPQFADPASGWGWQAPFFQVMMLSYKPNHVIAVWPPEQTIATPAGPVTLTSESLQASAVLAAETDLGLQRFNLDGQALSATGKIVATLPRLLINATRQEEAPERYDVILKAEAPVLAGLTATPLALERVEGDVTVVFTQPLDRHLATGAVPQVDGAVIHALALRRGPDTLDVTGDIGVDSQGFAEGDLQLGITQLDRLPDFLRALGLDIDVNPALLAMVSRAAGGGRVTLGLKMTRGDMLIGPIGMRIGPAPRLR